MLALIASATIVVSIVAARDALFGPGPMAIHDPNRLAARIHVCGRDYEGGSTPITRAAFGREAPFVLVDPAPFAPCAPAVDDPTALCATSDEICATFTVVFVRIGSDAYLPYELVGGP